MQSGEPATQQYLREFVAARGELIEHLALRHQSRFFHVIERTRKRHLAQHRRPSDRAAFGRLPSQLGDGIHGPNLAETEAPDSPIMLVESPIFSDNSQN